jgi:hypothetical protein
MPRSVEAILGWAIVVALAATMVCLLASFPVWPTLVGRADFEPIWMWRYRRMDVVVLAIAVFSAMAGVSALFRSERSNAH